MADGEDRAAEGAADGHGRRAGGIRHRPGQLRLRGDAAVQLGGHHARGVAGSGVIADVHPVLPGQLAALTAGIPVHRDRPQVADLGHDHKYESANGDLRTTLGDLVIRLAEDHTSYQRKEKASQGYAAISHMLASGHLPEDDGGGMLLRGLWKLSHTNGSHPGRSDADGARFRMQVITATARFLLRHFPDAT